jgi:hypothetical protein
MQIDLRACETLVINLPSDTARRAGAASLCDGLGLDYRFIEAVQCRPGPIGCGLSHIKALGLAADRATLILEDDVAREEPFPRSIDIPDDADAVYLGTSVMGAVEALGQVAFHDAIAAERVSDGAFRIHNMLSTHAILYLTDRYKAATSNAMLKAILIGVSPDRGLTMIQSQFRVYALDRPLFFQSAEHQSGEWGMRQELVTRQPFTFHPIGTRLRCRLDDQVRTFDLIEDAGALSWREIHDENP